MMLLMKNILFTVVAPGTVAVYVPLTIVRSQSGYSANSLAVSLALFLVGGAVYSWGVWDFATFGRGTPAPILSFCSTPCALASASISSWFCTKSPICSRYSEARTRSTAPGWTAGSRAPGADDQRCWVHQSRPSRSAAPLVTNNHAREIKSETEWGPGAMIS